MINYDNYDPLQYYGSYNPNMYEESEEEKRKRLAKAKPVTETIKTDPETGERTVTIKGTERDLSARNPYTPTVTGPVAPDNTFNRIIQAESGGRQFDAQGNILTSPKGAQGVAQIMPATAANPGFGVRPATPQEIATPEGNRAFGQRLFEGYKQYFGGDEAKAVAAYNAGPGRVQQNIQANQGVMNTAQLPRETQGFLSKVMNAAVPSAQASTLPPATVTAQPSGTLGARQQQQVVNTQPVVPTQMPAPGGTGNQPQLKTQPDGYFDQKYYDDFAKAQNSVPDLIQYAARPDVPEGMKTAANAQLYHMINQQRNEEKARETISNDLGNDPLALAKALKEKKEEGSWIKAGLYRMLGNETLANAEYVKLGVGQKQTLFDLPDGRKGIAWIRPDGMPTEGYDVTTGRALNARELALAAGGGGEKAKLDVTGGTFTNPDLGISGKVVTRTKDGKSQTMIESGGKLYDFTTKWVKDSVSGNVDLQTQLTINKNALNELNDLESKQGVLPEPQRMQFLLQRGWRGSTDTSAPTRTPSPQIGTTPTAGVPTAQTPVQAPAPQPAGPYRGVANAPAGSVPINIGTAPSSGMAATNLAVSETERKSFVEKDYPELSTTADKSSTAAGIRRQQMDILQRSPEIAGILSGAGGIPSEVGNMLRDLIAGTLDKNGEMRLSERINSLSLNPDQKAALNEFVNLQRQILPLSLKSNAGPGAVSQPEHQLNREANIDIARNPIYSGMTGITFDQYRKDMDVYKRDYTLATNAQTLRQLDSGFNAEKAKIGKIYKDIYAARYAYVQKHGGTGNTQAVAAAFKLFPPPQYDAERREWQYSGESEKIARPPLSSFKK